MILKMPNMYHRSIVMTISFMGQYIKTIILYAKSLSGLNAR